MLKTLRLPLLATLVFAINPLLSKGFAAAIPSTTTTPHPAPAPASHLSQEDEDLKKVQDYLNGISTFNAAFQEAGPDGLKNGTLWWDRKNKKITMVYDTHPMRLFLNQKSLTLFQPEEASTYDISLTPAGLLLKDHMKFSDVSLKELFCMKNGASKPDSSFEEKNLFCVSFSPKDEDSIKLTLVFTTYPMIKLIGWILLDNRGQETEVFLENVTIGVTLPEEVFIPKKLENFKSPLIEKATKK